MPVGINKNDSRSSVVTNHPLALVSPSNALRIRTNASNVTNGFFCSRSPHSLTFGIDSFLFSLYDCAVEMRVMDS